MNRTRLLFAVFAGLAATTLATNLQAQETVPDKPTLHQIRFNNTSTNETRGLVKFGLAFEKTDIPIGQTPQLRNKSGEQLRCYPIETATWSDGSLRKAVMVADLGMIEGHDSLDVEVYAFNSPASTSDFEPVRYIKELDDDLTVELTNHSGSESGKLSDLKFSLKNASKVNTRVESQATTPLFHRFFSWEKSEHEEHLVCLHYVDFWLEDGRVVGIEWTPVLSQHWWVQKPFGVAQTKERHDYDAKVMVGKTTVDARSGLQHAYYCRWASLYSEDDDQHATPHWIKTGDVAKPTISVEYSTESRKKMARIGYLPPLAWESSGWEVNTEKNYTPLGLNGHRQSINDVGAYLGRGAVTKPGANAIAVQTSDAWRRARVAANAGLSVYVHVLDHRTADREPGLRLIPHKFTQIGPQTYEHLGSELIYAEGDLGTTLDLADDPADGGTGAFINYDTAHHVNYAALMAFVTGERFLFDSLLGQFEKPLSSIHFNQYGHDRRPEYFGSERGKTLGIPNIPFGTLPYVTQQRAKGWSANAMLWTWAMLPDNDPHFQYMTNALTNYDNWFSSSMSYFPQDNLEYGGFDCVGGTYVDLWMQNFGPICIYPWLSVVEDQHIGNGGFRKYCDQVMKLTLNAYSTKRLYAIGAYALVWPCDDNSLNFIPGEKDLFPNFDATYSDGRFTTQPYTRLPWGNGDKVIFSSRNRSNVEVATPSEFSKVTLYYMVNVTGTQFELAKSPGGDAISSQGEGKTNLGISAASWEQELAGLGGTYAVGPDSYFTIAGAAIAAAYLAGNPLVTREIHDDFMKFLSRTRRASYSPWNYIGTQAAEKAR